MPPKETDTPGGEPGDRIDEEAAAWLARLRHDSRRRTRRGFEIWLASDARHRDAFRRVSAGYADAGRHRPLWRQTIGADPGPRTLPFAAALAALLLVVGGGFIAWRETRPAAPSPSQIASSDTRRVVRLIDGSIATLQPHSRIAPDYSRSTRLVTLAAGRVRFDVAHDPLHPFVVRTSRASVTARGTVFDVAISGENVMVRMIDGVVEVRSARRAAQPIRLVKGQRLTLLANDREVMMQSAEDPADIPPYRVETAIPTGANDQSLASIVAAVNRQGGKPIRLSGEIGVRVVHGQFDLTDSRAVALQLAAALDLDLREDDTGYVLAPFR